MQTLKLMTRALPLCCSLLFVAAAEDECTIRIVTDDDDCEDVDEVCNLDCVLAVNDEGCEICECAGDPPPPEQCESDADCPDGLVCALVACTQECELRPDGSCAPCEPAGGVCVAPDACAAVLCSPDTFCVVDENGQAQCIPVDGRQCFSDEECGPGSFCDFSTCGGGGGTEPGDPDGSGNEPGQDIACTGICAPIDQITCANVLCDFGSHCEDTLNGPVCVPDQSECNVDEDCGPNGRCEVTCQQDPNCPQCDVCLLVGKCVGDDVCPALCGPGSDCVIREDGTVECIPVEPQPECRSDADCVNGGSCNAGDICLPPPGCGSSGGTDPGNGGAPVPPPDCTQECWGFCEAPQGQSCLDDSECAAGEVCELRETCLPCADGDPACLAPCFVEGQCVPAP